MTAVKLRGAGSALEDLGGIVSASRRRGRRASSRPPRRTGRSVEVSDAVDSRCTANAAPGAAVAASTWTAGCPRGPGTSRAHSTVASPAASIPAVRWSCANAARSPRHQRLGRRRTPPPGPAAPRAGERAGLVRANAGRSRPTPRPRGRTARRRPQDGSRTRRPDASPVRTRRRDRARPRGSRACTGRPRGGSRVPASTAAPPGASATAAQSSSRPTLHARRQAGAVRAHGQQIGRGVATRVRPERREPARRARGVEAAGARAARRSAANGSSLSGAADAAAGTASSASRQPEMLRRFI